MFQATRSELCWKKKQRAFYEGQNVEWDVGEQESSQIFKEHLHNPHSLLPDSVNSAFYSVACVVFGYYWCIIWGGWGGKEGDGLGSFWLKFGETVKQRKRTTNDDWVQCPEYCILSKNVIGNLNEDCERLFKSCECKKKKKQIKCSIKKKKKNCECLKLRGKVFHCLNLMLFPTKR